MINNNFSAGSKRICQQWSVMTNLYKYEREQPSENFFPLRFMRYELYVSLTILNGEIIQCCTSKSYPALRAGGK